MVQQSYFWAFPQKKINNYILIKFNTRLFMVALSVLCNIWKKKISHEQTSVDSYHEILCSKKTKIKKKTIAIPTDLNGSKKLC